eukprot:3093536-Pleurochrysis_carterae.AAC.1
MLGSDTSYARTQRCTGTPTPIGPRVTQLPGGFSGTARLLYPGHLKKQPTVALSSCEAEIVAASEATKEAVYLRSLFAELGLPQPEPTPLSMDNKSAIDLAYNPEHHQRTKHIDRRHFFVREKVESHDITVPFVRSSENMADFFTKPLPPRVFFPLRDVIMNVVS